MIITTEQKNDQNTVLHEDKPASSRRRVSKITPPKTKAASIWPFISKEIFFGTLFISLGFMLASFYFFQNQLAVTLKQSLREFQWVVLVEGDQLTLDEAGRFLKQLEGVASVEFLSGDRVLERLQLERVADEDSELLKLITLPSAWVISWSENSSITSTLQTVLSDIKNFPGVTDVAYRREALSQMNVFRLHLYQTQTALALFYTLILVPILFLLGRVLFFSKFIVLKIRKFWPLTVLGLVCWMTGVMIGRLALGAVPPFLYLMGFLVCFIRPLFSLVYEKE